MMDLQRKIAILGATGSIGTQALDIARHYPERFRVVCLTARSSAEKLFDLVREFRPRVAALDVEPETLPEDVRFCEWVLGEDSSARALQISGADDALCAVVGIAGLSNVWAALSCCERVLLANKEALVVGGDLVMERARSLNRQLLPVDSEHSAIFQCLRAREGNPVRHLILTASGGALRDRTAEEIENASVEDVLRHPTWRMGAKITVDCATLMNKGLEVIEASWLFDMPEEKIQVVVHRESIIHSMIQYKDHGVIAQLGLPDMAVPIQYALTYPRRLPSPAGELDLCALGALTFCPPDEVAFPCLALCREALRRGGLVPAAANGANEQAVALFLEGKIGFLDIPRLVEAAMARQAPGIVTLEAVLEADKEARAFVAGAAH